MSREGANVTGYSHELKRLWIKSAKQLGYDEQCIKELEAAETVEEWSRIMARARKRVYGGEY